MNNRGMFFQNLNQGYSDPGMIIPPSGYNLNSQYQVYGQNINPNQMQIANPNQMQTLNQANFVETNDNYYEERVSKLERQVKNLDTRLQKIENIGKEEDNFYMI